MDKTETVVHPVRVVQMARFHDGPDQVIIARDIRRPGGMLQTQSLNHQGEWEDRPEGFEATAADRHKLER